jgi:hypothetical protein
MTPEREFLIAVLSQYLDRHPSEAKEQAIDLCLKYLEQQEKTVQLHEHCKLLEEKLKEMEIDYQILRMELKRQQQQNFSLKSHSPQIRLPPFLASASLKYL